MMKIKLNYTPHKVPTELIKKIIVHELYRIDYTLETLLAVAQCREYTTTMADEVRALFYRQTILESVFERY